MYFGSTFFQVKLLMIKLCPALPIEIDRSKSDKRSFIAVTNFILLPDGTNIPE